MVVRLHVREHCVRQQDLNAGGKYFKSIYSQQNSTCNYDSLHLPKGIVWNYISLQQSICTSSSLYKVLLLKSVPSLACKPQLSCQCLRTYPSAAQMCAIDSALLRSLFFRCGRTRKWRLWKIRRVKPEPLRLSEELQHSDCQLVRGAKGQTCWVGYQATLSLTFLEEYTFQCKTWNTSEKCEREGKEPIQGGNYLQSSSTASNTGAASFVPPCIIFMVTSMWLSGQANPYRTRELSR